MPDRIWREAGAVRGVIHGALASKSNRRRLFFINAKKGVCPCPCHPRFYDAGLAELEAICRECTKSHERKPTIVKSEEALAYEKAVVKAAKASRVHGLLLDGQLALDVVVYQENLRRDLDVELLCDCLQEAEVIKNDRAFWEKRAWRRVDRQNPRVEFRIRSIAGPVHVQEDLFATIESEEVPF
jgi:Holliday junction resolvase RusA-like endonuclease